MGDRYTVSIQCGNCHKVNEDIYYAESSEATTFVCENCKVRNRIIMTFTAIPEQKILERLE